MITVTQKSLSEDCYKVRFQTKFEADCQRALLLSKFNRIVYCTNMKADEEGLDNPKRKATDWDAELDKTFQPPQDYQIKIKNGVNDKVRKTLDQLFEESYYKAFILLHSEGRKIKMELADNLKSILEQRRDKYAELILVDKDIDFYKFQRVEDEFIDSYMGTKLCAWIKLFKAIVANIDCFDKHLDQDQLTQCQEGFNIIIHLLEYDIHHEFKGYLYKQTFQKAHSLVPQSFLNAINGMSDWV